jgi:hypothetical protein
MVHVDVWQQGPPTLSRSGGELGCVPGSVTTLFLEDMKSDPPFLENFDFVVAGIRVTSGSSHLEGIGNYPIESSISLCVRG